MLSCLLQKQLKKTALFNLLVLTYLLTGMHTVGAQIDTVAGDLLQRFETIRTLMPIRDTEGFLQPTNEELQRWRQLVIMLITENFETADSLVQADFPFYKLYRFTDTGLNDHDYYLLQENQPLTKGWGTFLVNPKFERPICIGIPHPVFDTNTYRQGADIFRRTGARFLIMTGTHRCANDEISLQEDEIWTRIRLNPHTLPTGDIEIIPGKQFARFRHFKLKAEKATATLKRSWDLFINRICP